MNQYDKEGEYDENNNNMDPMTPYSNKQSDIDHISEAELSSIMKNKKTIQEYQIKDAKYRQKEDRLQKQNDYLKMKLATLKLKITKLEEHRAQDAEALIDQEDKLSRLKGRYRTSDNPNEINKVKKNIQTSVKQENQVRGEIRE